MANRKVSGIPEESFLGTYPCAICRSNVRVYGWLPEDVLCAKHRREIDSAEAAATGPDEYFDT